MKNYYVYQDSRFVRSFNTPTEGMEWALGQLRQWQDMGRPKMPAYRVCYNGSQSVLFWTNVAPSFLKAPADGHAWQFTPTYPNYSETCLANWHQAPIAKLEGVK